MEKVVLSKNLNNNQAHLKPVEPQNKRLICALYLNSCLMFSEYKKDTVLVWKIQIQIDILDLKKIPNVIITKVPLIKWLMILSIIHQLQPMFSLDMITNLHALAGHHGNV